MAGPLRVLVVEDSEDDTRLLVRELERAGYDVSWERVETAGAMRSALEGRSWDLVTADYTMPKFSAPAALKLLRETGLDLPFIIVSGTVGEDVAVEVMKAGAHDFLLKGSLKRLVPAVEREIEQAGQRRARRQAEEALTKRDLYFRSLIENAQDVIAVIDFRGDILFVSPAIERILGHPPDEYVGKSAFELIHPEDAAGVQAALRRAVDDAKLPQTVLLRIRHADDSWHTLEGIGKVLADEGSSQLVVNLRDVTESRALEQQLRQAQKMEAVGRLAGGIAHDFNNLLTAILGYSDLLLIHMTEDDPKRESLLEIRKSGERAAALTRQLLAFSRKQVLRPQVLDLNAVISEMEKILRRVIGEDLSLRTRLAEDLGTVKADPGQIEQVILNLAINSRDAMPTGGKLTIETANVDLDDAYVMAHAVVRPGRYVMIAVSDTGIGMDAETKSHLFEPFFTTKTPGKGTGLGLATAYGIVKQSDGYIWVYSEPGQGTTFKIYLPRVEEIVEPKPASPSTSLLPAGSETILLVEDEEGVRRLVRTILGAQGYTVLEATDGAAALGLLERHDGPIHLVLTDVVMPGLSGPELSCRVADIRPAARVLFMSGYTEDAMIRHGVLAKGTILLEKPFTPSSLLRKVREVLDVEKQSPEGP
jgi:two-component system cell cycle sensor histidine kinase/response regulator CckA